MRFGAALPQDPQSFQQCMGCFRVAADAAMRKKKELDRAHEEAEKSNAANPIVEQETKIQMASDSVTLLDFDAIGVVKESELRLLVVDLRDQTNIGTVSPGQDKPLRLLLKRAEEKKNAIPAEDVALSLIHI